MAVNTCLPYHVTGVSCMPGVWDRMGQDGTGWDRMGQDGTVWDSMGQYGTVWDSMGQYGTVWDSMGQYGTVWDSMGVEMLTSVIFGCIYVG